MRNQRIAKHTAIGASVLVAALALSACSGAGGGSSSQKVTLTLATVDNPQMKDMQQLKGEFESSHPNIKVNFVQMEENDLRAAVTRDVASGAGQYDIVTVGANEISYWAQNGWITKLDPYIAKDPSWDVDDVFPAVREGATVGGKLYGATFYGETSVLMYNKSMVQAAGITIPEHPTWDEIEADAEKLNTADHAGICMRGKPGWGEFGAALTSMLYTSGSGWFDKNWKAQLTTPKFESATERYLRILKDGGEADPASFGFTECLNLFSQGKAAMWVDSTSAAGTLETPGSSSVVGNVGYVHAPVVDSKESGLLWSWNLAIPKSSKDKDAAWQFVSWATSKGYLQLVGKKLGWERVPPGSRISTYKNQKYLKAAAAFAPITEQVMSSINATQFGPLSQPYNGFFPSTPDWPALGDKVTQDLADVMAGRTDLKAVLEKDQPLAQEVGDKAAKSKK